MDQGPVNPSRRPVATGARPSTLQPNWSHRGRQPMASPCGTSSTASVFPPRDAAEPSSRRSAANRLKNRLQSGLFSSLRQRASRWIGGLSRRWSGRLFRTFSSYFFAASGRSRQPVGLARDGEPAGLFAAKNHLRGDRDAASPAGARQSAVPGRSSPVEREREALLLFLNTPHHREGFGGSPQGEPSNQRDCRRAVQATREGQTAWPSHGRLRGRSVEAGKAHSPAMGEIVRDWQRLCRDGRVIASDMQMAMGKLTADLIDQLRWQDDGGAIGGAT